MSTKGGQKSRTESKLSNSNGAKAPAPTNAWARPLQPKRTTAPPPGMGPPTKPVVAPSKSPSFSSSICFQHRERLLHLSLTLVGRKVILHQTNGAIAEGILHTFTPFSSLPMDQRNRYVLKEIQIQQQPSNETALKDGITLVVPASKVVYLHAVDIAASLTDVNNMNGASIGFTNLVEGSVSKATFATDTQISSSTASGRTNDLVAAGNAWTTAGNNSYRSQVVGAGGSGMLQATNSRAAALAGNNKGGSVSNNQQVTSSDVTGGKISGSIGQWDQFKANKELFNVNATYDENLYTTQLDTSQMDAKKMAEAERIANEIKNTATSNIHMAEERGFKVETDFDEEDLYSGVLTKDGKQRHEKVIISKITVKEKEIKNTINSAKSSSASPLVAPKKIMNYAAAAAKADASKNKNIPPGFRSSTTPVPATSSNEIDENKETVAEVSTAVITTEKMTTKNVESTKKISTPSVPTSAPEDVEEKTEKTKCLENDENPSKNKEISEESASKATDKSSDDGSVKKNNSKIKTTEKKIEKKGIKKSSKLNANAKSFTFNPSAKTFTPTFGGSTTSNPPPQQPPHPAATTDPGMQIYGGVHPIPTPHYMQAGPMTQPGMIQVINPQYPGMRYPTSYGIEQPIPQMQHQAPPSTSIPSAPSSGNAPTPTTGIDRSIPNSNDDEQGQQRREDETSQTLAQGGGQQSQRSQQQQPDQSVHSQASTQQQQIPLPYSVPPNAYFSPGMGIPPRGPGYAQFVAGPAGRPGVPQYGIYPMPPGGMPQNIQMRGPGTNPYYPGPNGPIPYPPGAHMGYPIMDDGGRGRGGRSSNSGRGGRGRGGRSGRGGRGRSNYNNSHNSGGTSGKNSQQQYNHQHTQQQQQPQFSNQQAQSGNTSSNKSD
mmetsp:Transcript_887/g.1865  ORF Transcript_887/g.1865 Transcript_887/m.1865 type:complete len:886 (+) Transcript_887:270-2927(+)|eukprot:CAMPEP_0197182538 /NCGR_PEP_ID=MMETSP1423-20130617/6460_1 /TAXON_ID=476441 /ORGANISM="Pseudo-nitzschia heimii, Strain UNC1101" /LENGTH=885 /DNA_ID=CAMNT_0042632975 /DNA_START=252 /DNA_END=2909 /DNA_ORIENTATION=+